MKLLECNHSHASAEMTVKLSVLISLWQQLDWLLHLAVLCCQNWNAPQDRKTPPWMQLCHIDSG